MPTAEPTSHIGDFQATKQDDRAHHFESFVVTNDLWLPATFEECQEGAGCTWTHSTGHRKRLDFIGLPRCWHVQSCRAWVSDCIDPTILRADHAAACVEVCFDSILGGGKGEDSRERPNFGILTLVMSIGRDWRIFSRLTQMFVYSLSDSAVPACFSLAATMPSWSEAPY
eukprot:s5733_g3.t1